jgi:hypothetical protein
VGSPPLVRWLMSATGRQFQSPSVPPFHRVSAERLTHSLGADTALPGALWALQGMGARLGGRWFGYSALLLFPADADHAQMGAVWVRVVSTCTATTALEHLTWMAPDSPCCPAPTS